MYHNNIRQEKKNSGKTHATERCTMLSMLHIPDIALIYRLMLYTLKKCNFEIIQALKISFRADKIYYF